MKREERRPESDELEPIGTDHLIPLPDPTPRNLARVFVGGATLGGLAMLLDSLMTARVFGFENAYLTFALVFSMIFAITGAFRDNSVPMVMGFITGLLVGAFAINAIRVHAMGQTTLLGAIGL